jgi:hypothetical protein
MRLHPWGALDLSFGGAEGGTVFDIVKKNHTEYARAAWPRKDGSVIVVGEADGAVGKDTLGDVYMAHVLADGRLDPDFGDGGFVASDGTGADDLLFSAKRAPGGAIVAAGFTGSVLYAIRFRPNGMLDRSITSSNFAIPGFAIPFESSSRGSDVVDVRGQNKILVTGELEDNLTIVRLSR